MIARESISSITNKLERLSIKNTEVAFQEAMSSGDASISKELVAQYLIDRENQEKDKKAQLEDTLERLQDKIDEMDTLIKSYPSKKKAKQYRDDAIELHEEVSDDGHPQPSGCNLNYF